MGFSFTGYKPKVPSMASYSGNVQDYRYKDKQLNDVGITRNNDVQNVEMVSVDNVNTDSRFVDGIKRTGATAATGILSVGEGVCIFGEALVDTGAIIGSGIVTPFTWLGDKIFGTNHTEEMWSETRSFVSEEHVKNAFDNYYDNTDVGQALKNNAYGFDTVRSVGNEVGYIGGVVGLTVLTGGVGTAGLGAAGGGLSMSGTIGVIAGTAGVGRHTEEAWNSGAPTGRGLASGALGGAWDGVLYWTGGKIAGLAPSLSGSLNTTIRIGANTGLGFADGFLRPVVNSVASGKSYNEEFMANGGFRTVAIEGLMAGGLSGIGERGLRNRIQFGGTRSKVTGPIDPAYRSKLISEFDALFLGGNNHTEAVNYYHNLFSNTDNIEALEVLATIIDAKKQNPNFVFTTCVDAYNTSFYSRSEARINITKNAIRGKRTATGMHEAGHLLYDFKLSRNVPNEWNEIAARARLFNSNKAINVRNDFIVEASKQRRLCTQLGNQEFNKLVGIGEKWASFDEYFNYMFEQNKAKLLATDDATFLRDIEIGKALDDRWYQVSFYDEFIKDATELQIESNKTRIGRDIYHSDYSDYMAISDILDALYEGTGKDLNGKTIGVENIAYHGDNYYDDGYVGLSFDEIIANYTQLKTTGSKRSIQLLRQMCGDEFVETLEKVYKTIK
ncbi:MAG: hypothetical protein IJL76_03825 [Bacilli bacterium]|nr:hypothetical protein [Bacilli bacterium]